MEELPLGEPQSTTANSTDSSGGLHAISIGESQQPCPISPRDQSGVDSQIPRYILPINTLRHENLVCAVAISNPTRFIYTGGARSIKVWDLCNPFPSCPSAELQCIFSGRGNIKCLKLTQDGGTLVAAASPCVQIWDIAGCWPRRKGELLGQEYGCYELAISSDSRLCFGCCPNGDIAVWDLHNQTYIRRFRGHRGPSTSARISPDGTKLWTSGFDESVKCWDIVKGQCLTQFNFSSVVHSLDICPDGKWLVVGLENNVVEVLHVSKADRHQFHLHKQCVMKVRFATCGKWFASTGKDDILYCSSTPSGPPRATLYRGSFPIWNCEISADSQLMVTCSFDATVLKVIY